MSNANASKDSFKARKSLVVDGESYDYFSLAAVKDLGEVARLPFSLRVLLENLLRFEDGDTVTTEDIHALIDWLKTKRSDREIQYRPARVLMQDFTGVPAVVDLAAMRDAMAKAGGNPERINPLSAVDLVIDHSVMVDAFATPKPLVKTWPSRWSVTRSVTSSCVGASKLLTTSGWYRRAPASATR